MLFKKKKDIPVPIEEVQRLTRSGLSDRDIIKELKDHGYSYEQIEKAMLQAVKAGVGEADRGRIEEKQKMESIVGKYEEEPSEDMSSGELPMLGELYPSEKEEPLAMNIAPQEMALPELEQPELIIEELVEGVVEEKLQRFDEVLKSMDEKFEKIRVWFEQIKQRQEERREISTKDSGAEIAELSNRLEELETRIGGLEKAFKQFLPSLTHNIESLSAIVHEMKSKGL